MACVINGKHGVCQMGIHMGCETCATCETCETCATCETCETCETCLHLGARIGTCLKAEIASPQLSAEISDRVVRRLWRATDVSCKYPRVGCTCPRDRAVLRIAGTDVFQPPEKSDGGRRRRCDPLAGQRRNLRVERERAGLRESTTLCRRAALHPR